LLVWPAGLYYYLLTKGGKPYQAFGWIYVVLFALFAFWNAKAYFLAPTYPILFAAGALVVERFIRWREWHWLKPVSVSFLLITGAIVAPIAVVPVLPVEALAKITEPLGGNAGLESEAREAAEIPQLFAFRKGWEEMVGTVAGVHRALPQEDREKSCVLAGDFGEAGALDLFGPRYGLPQVISGHNNYYLWGPGECTGEVVISVGVPLERLEEVFGSVEQADTVECEYCMPKQDDLPVYVARDSKLPFEEAWPQFKQFN
jgi:hypothetical protein